MIGVLLQTLGFGGVSIANLFNSLADFGFFAYVLPFLLIFAVVFAILSKIEIFKENKGANLIVSLAIGLLSLQFPQVPDFFAVLFSNFAIGLSIILVALILAGIFVVKESTYKWIFFGLGGFIFIVIVIISLSSYNFSGSWNFTYWWDNYGGLLMFLFLIIGVIVAVVKTNNGEAAKT